MIRSKLTDRFMNALDEISFYSSLEDKPLIYVNEHKYTINDIIEAIRGNEEETDEKKSLINDIIDRGISVLERMLK